MARLDSDPVFNDLVRRPGAKIGFSQRARFKGHALMLLTKGQRIGLNNLDLARNGSAPAPGLPSENIPHVAGRIELVARQWARLWHALPALDFSSRPELDQASGGGPGWGPLRLQA